MCMVYQKVQSKSIVLVKIRIVYKDLGILKALQIVLSETINILEICRKLFFSGCP